MAVHWMRLTKYCRPTRKVCVCVCVERGIEEWREGDIILREKERYERRGTCTCTCIRREEREERERRRGRWR